ncbi:unnamed protein product [Trifolium pratense]|uniref:Uncharacterized protein n=1 Tax=Trifolium pratense TaxID=57577 RepID=A0ACB0KX10_TRIPR|nr:unnamed protein product [Trifolium pratense]
MGKKTINSGVYVKGVSDGGEDDFYGVIKHIFELSYRYDNNVVLFYSKRGWCYAIKTKPRGQIETEVPDIEVPYQDDEMSHVPDVIKVDPITNLVDKDVDGPQIDAQVLIELLNNNEDDANNSEDNEEDRHIDEKDNEDGIFCSDE